MNTRRMSVEHGGIVCIRRASGATVTVDHGTARAPLRGAVRSAYGY